MQKQTFQINIKTVVLILPLALIAASIVLYVIQGPGALASNILFGLTGLSIIAAGALSWREILAFFRKSTSVKGAFKIAQFIIVISILLFIYLLSDSLSWKIDLTSSQLYSLSDETRNLIKAVTNEMNVLYFRPAPMNGPLLDYQENLIKAYVEKNRNFKYRKVDPYQNRSLAIDYDVKEDGMVVFEYQGNKIYIGLDKLFEQEPQSGKMLYKGEEAFTRALKSLTLSKPKTVYVMTGHGESNPFDKTSRGYRGIFEKLQQDNVKLNQLDLVRVPEIPVDCSLLIIANPPNSLTMEELDRLETYINNGGSLLILLEFETHITINEILRQMGLYFYQNLAIEDQDYNPQFGKTTVVPQLLPSEITKPLINNRLAVIMPTACGIMAIPAGDRPGKDQYTVTPLLTTSKSSFGETSRAEISANKAILDNKDLKGPLTLGYSVKRIRNSVRTTRNGEETNVVESRLVVFGDSDFVNNVYFMKYGNSDLFLNSVNFLLRREASITIRPKTSELNGFQLTGSERRFLTIFLIFIVLAYLLPGIFIVVQRRSKVKE